jgi:hypothetical protein
VKQIAYLSGPGRRPRTEVTMHEVFEVPGGLDLYTITIDDYPEPIVVGEDELLFPAELGDA